jgi:hypothetical protein
MGPVMLSTKPEYFFDLIFVEISGNDNQVTLLTS